MATPEQMIRAQIAAARVNAPVGPTAGSGATQAATAPLAPNPTEAADTAAITAQPASNYVLPSIAGVAKGMLTPQNLVTTGAEAASGALLGPETIPLAGRLAQVPATMAQRGYDSLMGNPSENGFLRDLAGNAVTNEVGTQIGKRILSPLASKIGQSGPLQNFRKGVAKFVMGRVTPDAIEAAGFGARMIDDLQGAVDRSRQGAGLPLYARDALEKRIAGYLPTLKRTGLFTVGDLADGSKVDVAEGIASGSLGGRGTFGTKRANMKQAFEDWPKVYAALLGDPSQSPEQLASMASQEINRALRKQTASAGSVLQYVEDQVGKHPVDIGPELLDPLERQVALYAKLNAPAGTAGKVSIDPEGVDTPVKSAIHLVERATGKKWDPDTGDFLMPTEKVGGDAWDKFAGAELNVDAPNPTKTFTWQDMKTLRSNINAMAKRSSDSGKAQSADALGTLAHAIKGKMTDVLDAEDAMRGNTLGQPGSLRTIWESGRTLYKHAKDLEAGFPAQGWIEALDQKKAGAPIIKEIWPDNASGDRLNALRDLMGGEGSPYWDTLRRFKVQDMLNNKSPEELTKTLTSVTEHGAGYWKTALGEDNYKSLTNFAKTFGFSKIKNPLGGTGAPSRVDAGFIFGAIGLPLTIVTGHPVAAATEAAAAGSWLVSTNKMAKWLTNPNDSAMLQALMTGGPLKQKARAWFRNEAGRAVAESTQGERPDIAPIPATVSRADYGAATGRIPAPTGTDYGGIRG